MAYGDDFYADKLSRKARAIYDAYLAELVSKDYSHSFSYKIPKENLIGICESGKEALLALSRDHPEFFFLPDGFVKQGNYLFFDNSTFYTEKQVKRIRELLKRELFLLTVDTKQYSPWDRERIIYERIASRYQYQQHEEKPNYDYDVAGLLMIDEGVCSAYVCMFILALRKAGITCHRVSGGGHAWVMVYINDIPCHCDVTWESHDGLDKINFTYFNLTSEEMSRDHTVPQDMLPISRFRGYGYHKKKRCFFSSEKDAEEYIRSSLQHYKCPVRIKVESELPINVIVKRGMRSLPFGEYRYSVNEKQGTAIIYKK